MSSKFLTPPQSYPGPQDQPGCPELPHCTQQVHLAVQLEQLQTSGDCEATRMMVGLTVTSTLVPDSNTEIPIFHWKQWHEQLCQWRLSNDC